MPDVTVIYDTLIMGLCLNRLFYHDVDGLVVPGFHKFPTNRATVSKFPVSHLCILLMGYGIYFSSTFSSTAAKMYHVVDLVLSRSNERLSPIETDYKI